MSDHARLARCDAALRAAGATPEDFSGNTHRKWRFPDGAFIQMPAHAHRGVRWDNAESVMRRAIRDHGVAVAPRPRSPGMRPSEVDDWVPVGPLAERGLDAILCTEVHPKPEEAPMPDPAPTGLMCEACAAGPFTPMGLNGHRATHLTPQPCPDCGQSFKNLGRHRVLHVGFKHAPKAAAPKAPKPTPVAPTLRALPVDRDLEGTLRAFDSLRVEIARLIEENKLLRREADKAQSMVDKARNFLGSRP